MYLFLRDVNSTLLKWISLAKYIYTWGIMWKYTLSVTWVTQEPVVLIFRDDKMNWEYSWINIVKAPINLLHSKNSFEREWSNLADILVQESMKLSSLDIEVINRYRVSQCIVSMVQIGTYYVWILFLVWEQCKGEKWMIFRWRLGLVFIHGL